MVAACDDDNGGMDMAQDMTATADMAVPADMTMMATPGTGRVVLAEVKGNVYAPVGDMGVLAVPGAQSLTAITTFPMNTVASDYVSPGFNPLAIATNTLYGCFGDRYNLPSDAPTPDENVGTVTFTGFNTPPSANATGGSGIPPDRIVCAHGGTTPYYGCVYAPTDAGTNFMGAPIGSVFTTGAGGNFITGGMTDITATVAGGGTYMAQTSTTMNAPDAPKILGVQVGSGTAVTALDQIGTISSANDVTVTWACDNAGTMPGDNCNTAGIDDVILISLLTSKDPRQSFSRAPTTTKFGNLTCVSNTNRTMTVNGAGKGTIIIPKEAIGTILGTTAADNKSYQIAVIRLKVDISKNSNGMHSMFYGAGRGLFGFNDL